MLDILSGLITPWSWRLKQRKGQNSDGFCCTAITNHQKPVNVYCLDVNSEKSGRALFVNKSMRNHLTTLMTMLALNLFTQTIQGKREGIQRFNIRVKRIHRKASKKEKTGILKFPG
jgi:hypothetical protein